LRRGLVFVLFTYSTPRLCYDGFIKPPEERILYRVLYFPLGSIERSYAAEDGGGWLFNLERPLSGLG